MQVWNVAEDVHTPDLLGEFNCGHGAVYAIVTTRDTIFAGCQDGYAKVLDLESNTSVRSLLVEEVCFPLSMLHLSVLTLTISRASTSSPCR